MAENKEKAWSATYRCVVNLLYGFRWDWLIWVNK